MIYLNQFHLFFSKSVTLKNGLVSRGCYPSEHCLSRTVQSASDTLKIVCCETDLCNRSTQTRLLNYLIIMCIFITKALLILFLWNLINDDSIYVIFIHGSKWQIKVFIVKIFFKPTLLICSSLNLLFVEWLIRRY
jgi:hypothetical protein